MRGGSCYNSRMATSLRWRALAASLVVGALCGCAAEGAGIGAITVRDSSGVAIVENDLARLNAQCRMDAAPTLSIGVEEGSEEYVLGSVAGAVRLSDGRIVLANRGTRQLRYYDSTGRFIRSSGREGEGPGEFRQPFYLHLLPGDTVYAGDFRPFRFLVFAPDGEWVRTVMPMPILPNVPATRNVLDDGRLVLGVRQSRATREAGFPVEMMTLQVQGADGVLLDTIAELPNGRYGEVEPGSNFFSSPFFESFPQVAATGSLIVIGHGSSDELRQHGTTSGYPLERIVRWTSVSRDITAADVAAEKARIAKQYETSDERNRALDLTPQIRDKRPVAERFPAFSGLMLGRDGRMWIREYQPPVDTSGRRWVAFTADGRFDCRLQTPRFREFLEVGKDHMLVLDEDSLGVERVKLFTITHP